MTLRRLILPAFLILLGVPGIALAQPAKKQIKSDLDAASAKSFKFEGRGKTEFDPLKRVHIHSQYATIVRKHPALKDVNVEIYGWAEYQSRDKQKWRFIEFHTASNKFEGIPNPSEKELRTAIDQNRQAFYGTLGDKIRGVVEVELAKDPRWEWEEPWKVTVRVLLRYERLAGRDTLEKVEHPVLVELFREVNDMKGPWKQVRKKKIRLTQQETMALAMEARKTGKLVDPTKETVLSTRQLTQDQLAKLPALRSTY